MFAAPVPQSASLTAVADSLTYNDKALSSDERTAASNTHLYIQEVALAHCKSEGLDIGDPNLYKSAAWYDALTWAVANYADWVEIVGSKSVTVNDSTHSGQINLSRIMGTVMALYLGPAAEAEWSALSDLLGGASSPAVDNFMDFWWSHVTKSSTDTGLSVGPNMISEDGNVQWAVCFYAMTHKIDDWRVMFVTSTYEEFDVSAGGLTLQMDMGVYNSDVKEALEKRLAKDIKNKINNVPLDSNVDSRHSPRANGGRRGSSSLATKIANAPLLRSRPLPVSTGY